MLENVILITLALWLGGVVFTAVGLLFVKALDILENDYD